MIKIADHHKKILLVDDDPGVSQILKLLLETQGYEFFHATSGQTAIQTLVHNIDLILLDLDLPDQNSFKICREIKHNQDLNHIPIIMFSTKGLSGDIIEGFYLGADDYLVKPFEYDDLVVRMEAIMRRGSVSSVIDRQEGQVEHIEQDVVLELRYIIDEELVVPVFQPIYYLDDYRILGWEALCRLTLKYSSITNPEVLFNLALRFGYYEKLEMIVWKKAMKAALPYLRKEKLFLNCNPYLIEGDKFSDIQALFEEVNLNCESVILEITERSAIAEYKTFYEHLTKFRKVGFQFAVDDVGGGYASLESIVETKPEVIKIDRHIIQDIDQDPFKRSIVKFIVAFCQENNVISIAEGIETKEALETLKQLGVQAGQGFYLYKPSPTIDISHMRQAVKNI